MRNKSSPMETMTTQVLVVGAGPSGLMLAGWLVRHGVDCLVLDSKPNLSTATRALVVHARTLETYDQLGLGESALHLGRPALGINVWSNGRHRARVGFDDMGRGISPHPYAFVLPQDKNEEILLEHLRRHGGSVRWQHRLLELWEQADGVRARVETPDGVVEILADYACGCDGASSTVRHAMGLKFPGGTYQDVFYVADVFATGNLVEGEINVALDRGDFQLAFPMPGEHRARLVGLLPEEFRGRPDLRFEEIESATSGRFGVEVAETTWLSSYKVHHRVASHFHLGRCFLVGDAAHVHSPVGGQGMNTGLMDATNLGWKLAAVLRRGANARLLESYSLERMPFAQRLVSTTDRAFAAVTSRSALLGFLRTRIFPFILALLSRLEWIRRWAFRVVSQTSIDYRASWVSRQIGGLPGKLQAGDRLPWLSSDAGPGNFAPLVSCDWQVHVYGEVDQTLADWTRLPVHRFGYGKMARRAGFVADAAYFIRPDGYIGLVMLNFDPFQAEEYLDEVAGKENFQR